MLFKTIFCHTNKFGVAWENHDLKVFSFDHQCFKASIKLDNAKYL